MSIKEAIPLLHDIYNYYNDTDVDAYVGFDEEDNQVVELAVDVLQKYQKIESLVKNRYGKVTWQMLDAIIKVVEDADL